VVLRCQMMWGACNRRRLGWRCIRSQLVIRLVHPGMRNDSMAPEELFMKRGCCVLQDFVFFSLYSFSCIAQQVTTLE